MIISGCAIIHLSINVPHLYENGEILFVKKSAQKGKLEKIAIKYFIPNTQMYKDTFNNLWEEIELCDRITADNLSQLFQDRQIQLRNQKPCPNL